MVAAVAVVALAAPRVLTATVAQLWAPFDLTLEVPTVNTILLLRQGVDVYARETFDAPPFNLLLYTPAYHYLVALVPWPREISPFTMPRLASAIAMVLAAAALCWTPVARGGRLLAVAAAGFFLAIPAVTWNIAYARQDPMALVLSLGAMLILSRGVTRGAIVASAALAALAVLTKQSYLSAALAGVVYLWIARRPHCRIFVLTLGVIGAAFAAGAHLAWGGGFWWSVLVAPTQSFDWTLYRTLPVQMAIQWTYVVLVVGGLLAWGLTTARWWSAGRGAFTPLTVYVPVAFLVSALMLGKRGAGLNYFFEPTLALLAYLVERAGRPPSSARGRLGLALVLLAFVSLFVLDCVRIPAERHTLLPVRRLSETNRFIDHLRAEVAALDGPKRRILFPPYMSPNFAYSLGGPVYVNDPVLYSLLWREGKLSVDSFIESVASGYFDVVVVPPDEDLSRPRYSFHAGTDRFYEALQRRYRLERTGLFQYHVRRAAPPP
jgi:4-amino-4-deoxy-L-arabinose transferase-like glycosyltransferase